VLLPHRANLYFRSSTSFFYSCILIYSIHSCAGHSFCIYNILLLIRWLFYTSDWHPLFCFYYEGLVRTMKTRHLLTVLFHKKRQMLRSMQNSTFRMLRLMKQMMTDPTPKVLKPPHSFYFVRYNFLFSTMYDNSLFVINHIWFCYKLLHVVVE